MRFRVKNLREGSIKNFGSVMPSIIKQFDLTEPYFVDNIRQEWSMIVGDIIATHSVPEKIYKNVLYISVDHSVYSNEIAMMKNTILGKIQNHYNAKLIKNIKVNVKRLHWKKK